MVDIFVDKTQLENLKKKYAAYDPKKIDKWVESHCERFNTMNLEQREVFGFEKGNKFIFNEKIKDGLIFYDTSIKNPTPEEASKNNTGEVVKKVKTGKLSKSIFNRVCSVIKRYIDTTPENIEILSLWLIGTYFHKDFETFPLLQLYAQKRSGKTRTLKLLSNLAFGSDGSVSTSPTETHLFRHKEGALFFDEMENISSKERGAFRETLNAIYKKGNKIIRYKETKIDGTKEYIEDAFYPYYPLALANIRGLNDVLEDRAVQVILRRSNKKVTKLVEDFKTNKEIIQLKEELSQLEATIPKDFFTDWNNFVEEKKIKDENLKPLFEKISSSGIFGRFLEIFFPLFIIADLCGVVDIFLKTADNYIKKKEEDELVDDYDERLKQFIFKEYINENGFVGISSILNRFKQDFESPEEWINSKWLGRALKRLDLVKQKRNYNGKVQVILNNNSTYSTNTTNTTNSTNSTKKVGLVDFVGFIGDVDKEKTDKNKFGGNVEVEKIK